MQIKQKLKKQYISLPFHRSLLKLIQNIKVPMPVKCYAFEKSTFVVSNNLKK